MTTKRRKDRAVVFRLTEEEYDGLRKVCETKSGRSLSDFARSKLLGSMRLAEAALPRDPWGSIERRIAVMETELRNLARQIESLSAQGAAR